RGGGRAVGRRRRVHRRHRGRTGEAGHRRGAVERRPEADHRGRRRPARQGRAGRHEARPAAGSGRRSEQPTARPAPDPLTPVLSDTWDADRSWTLASYLDRGGYAGLRAALGQDPADVVATVKASGLRGRGGAGFPTGMKWGFLPAPDGGPRYLVVNADES